MTKTFAVIGSTGQQGGAVAKAMLKADGWKVRGITRNTKGRGAQALASEGAEMVTADIDDVESMSKAFEVRFRPVTNFWEHLGQGLDADAAGAKEAEQAFSIALAASKVPTLEHYVFSTLPKALDLTKGERPVPHMDHKAGVDDRIRKELPELAAKTTFVWLGWYAANMASEAMGLIRPFELPKSGGKYIWMQPSKADALLPICGDVGVNVGVYVRGALEHPEKSRGKYVYVRTDRLTFTEILKIWSEVSGREAEYVPISPQAFEAIWGPGGKEMAMQYQSGEMWEDWDTLKPGEVCTPEELGVKAEELVGLKQELEKLKSHLL
ncbi:hypothetical protein B0A55_03324 [Friedmanniomyces simplex]|uniref:NmrA-like domain-containing protein n=1 Tax=Friedmanniomyces simplex TaxID=329884 RepID=A0A4U0XYA3_9PEZI|nr:hypothetical protein B0A55_03324 [Friedmanniomyces simplex]